VFRASFTHTHTHVGVVVDDDVHDVVDDDDDDHGRPRTDSRRSAARTNRFAS
jgi:hypothetical protein